MGGQLGLRLALALSGKTIMNFSEKWLHAQQKNHSKLAIGLAPRVLDMPAPIMRYDDPFLPFGRAIIENTADLACAYVFDLASYLALGAAGARALERTIPIVPLDIPKILHAPFVTAGYVRAAFEEAFAVDAVTLATEDRTIISAYLQAPQHGAFIPSLFTERGQGGEVNLGTYDANGFTLGANKVRWVTDEIIYASAMLNFAEKVRRAAEHYRKLSHE